jgi:hypothetical protein
MNIIKKLNNICFLRLDNYGKTSFPFPKNYPLNNNNLSFNNSSLKSFLHSCAILKSDPRNPLPINLKASGSVLLRREDESNSSLSTIYLNIFLLFGIGFCLSVPILIYFLTGVNIYNNSSFTDSIYSMSLFEIRKICATVCLYLLIYFVLFNKNKLKQSILNKPIMWASCLIVRGGFEGLGDPELETQHVNPQPLRTLNSRKLKELDEDLLSLDLLDAQIESLSTSSPSTPPRLNPEVCGVTIPYPPGSKTAGPSTGSRLYNDSPYLYSPSPGTAIPAEGKKKVRFNDNEEVQELPDLASFKQEWSEEPVKKVGGNSKQRAIERDQNISYNSDPTETQTFNTFKGKRMNSFDIKRVNFIWNSYYKNEEELENSPKIGSLDQNQELETTNTNTKIENSNSLHSVRKTTPHSNILEAIKRSKPSGTVATSNFENIKGQLYIPTTQLDLLNKLKDLSNKK